MILDIKMSTIEIYISNILNLVDLCQKNFNKVNKKNYLLYILSTTLTKRFPTKLFLS